MLITLGSERVNINSDLSLTDYVSAQFILTLLFSFLFSAGDQAGEKRLVWGHSFLPGRLLARN